MRLHPFTIIILGLLCTSIGFNILYHTSNQKLIYRIQKLETGPATGIFYKRENKESKQLSDEEINELIRQMLAEQALNKLV